ncbi:MAG: VWA domain-containing protein, partial [Planctomycetales bacterium]|nr:VWA domain-containing protein [Planctomycetales bacterium]
MTLIRPFSLVRCLSFGLIVVAASLVGCGDSGTSQSPATSGTTNTSATSDPPPSDNSTVSSRPMGQSGGSGDGNSSSGSSSSGGIRVTTLGGGQPRTNRPNNDQALSEDAAVDRMMEQFEQYAAQDRVVVAWLFDQSAQSEVLSRASAGALIDYYSEHDECQVDSLIAGVDSDTTWFTEDPTRDSSAIGDAVDQLTFKPQPSLTFGGMEAALERLSPYRDDRAMIAVVLITGEVGGDWQQADDVATRSRSMTAPIYVVGYAAPFGLTALRNERGEADGRAYGPETPEPEFLPFQLTGAGTGAVVLDSGFGPWGLERVSRAGGGAFLAIRPPASRFSSAMTYDSRWPSDVAPRFDAATMARYAPNYGSLEDYRTERDGNKAIAALLTVARRFPMARTIQNPIMQFDATDEAALKNALDIAQQPAALLSPNLNTIADILKEGEADRAKITNPRWQAAYDLAMGQALAAVVRVDGYNGMLAQLKTGKSFTNPKSDVW